MTTLQLTATRTLAALAALVLASCSNDPVADAKPLRPVEAPNASEPMNTAGSTSAGRTAPTPVVDSGAPDSQVDADVDPQMDAAVPNIDDDDAGTWVPPELECEDDVWRLAPGFLVAQRIEYVADRSITFSEVTGQPVVTTLSEAGERCGGAKNKPACEKALELIPPVGARHLVTTLGDSVRVYDQASILSIFGRIDTPAEALWYAQNVLGFFLRCNVIVTPLTNEDGFEIKNLLGMGVCGSIPPLDLADEFKTTIELLPDGNFGQTQIGRLWEDPACQMPPPML